MPEAYDYMKMMLADALKEAQEWDAARFGDDQQLVELAADGSVLQVAGMTVLVGRVGSSPLVGASRRGPVARRHCPVVRS